MVLVNINIVQKGSSFRQPTPGCKNGLVVLVQVNSCIPGCVSVSRKIGGKK